MKAFIATLLVTTATLPAIVVAQEAPAVAPAAMVRGSGTHITTVDRAATISTAVPAPAAPVRTTITADGSTATDIQHLGGQWLIDGGTLAGTNLFHNFDAFSLANGGSAVWTFSFGDPASIANVINRVTGGAPSLIDGTLDSSALPNADFFFINPAGIVFHENALVDVGASAHFTTASELSFSDGAVMSAATPNGSTFSIATPDKLGFFGTEAALSVLSGETPVKSTTGGGLHLSGADLLVDGLVVDATSFVATATGSATTMVDLSPKSWTGEFAYSGDLFADRLDLLLKPLPNPTANVPVAVIAGANVTLSDSSLILNRAAIFGSGSVVIDGEDVLLSNTKILTIASDDAASGDISISGRDGIALLNSALRTATATVAAAGDIILIGGDVRVDPGSSIISTSGSEALPSSNIQSAGHKSAEGIIRPQTGLVGSPTGPVGNITITGSEIYLAAQEISSFINVSALASFSTINVVGEIITLDGTRIANSAGDGAGIITISAAEINVIDSSIKATAVFGGGGDIYFDADDYLGLTNSIIGASSLEGLGGNVVLGSDRISIGQSIISTSRSGGVSGGFSGGGILIRARDVQLQDSGILSQGLGGLVPGEGVDGGSIVLDIANTATITNTSISSSAPFGGSGGEVSIYARQINVDSGSQLTTSADGFDLDTVISSAKAGSILLQAENITISDEVIVASEGDFSANGGNITLAASETLQIGNGALVSSTLLGSTGIDINQFTLDDIPATAGEVTLKGRLVQIEGGTIASIVSESAMGTSGTVTIEGERIELTDGATITAANLGLSDGSNTTGAVRISGNHIELRNGSAISTNSTNGPAGDIILTLPEDGILRLVGGENGPSIITTSSGPGTGGVITIGQPVAIISQGGEILALGDAGGANVQINAPYYIDAADTLDRIAVDGDLTFEGEIDYSAVGEKQRDPGLIDAGAILSGRCQAAFASGETSQLSVGSPGPYGSLTDDALPDDSGDSGAASAHAERKCG